MLRIRPSLMSIAMTEAKPTIPEPYQMEQRIRLPVERWINPFPVSNGIKHKKAEMMNQNPMSPKSDFCIDYYLMNFINDAVKSAIQDRVQEVVDRELSLMIKGDGFKKRVTDLIDTLLQAIAGEITIKTSGAGPGRGRKGKSLHTPPRSEAQAIIICVVNRSLRTNLLRSFTV